MKDLVIPDCKVIDPVETLFRKIRDKYITITKDSFKLETSFTLIDRCHCVSFYRPYIIGLEYLSERKMNIDFKNAQEIVNYITKNVNVTVRDVIEIGKRELMRQAKKRWKKEVIFCEFSLDAFKRNGFTAQGQPNKINISHAIVDFNLSSKTMSRQAEKYMSENDMVVYASDPLLAGHPKIVVLKV